MKTITLFALFLVALGLFACAPSTPLSGSTQNAMTAYASFAATNDGSSLVQPSSVDNLYIVATNVSEKNFTVSIWGINGTNASVTESLSINGSTGLATSNKYRLITKFGINATPTQSYKIYSNTTRYLLEAVVLSGNSTPLFALNGIEGWLPPNFVGNSSPMKVSQFTELGEYTKCAVTGSATTIVSYVSPNGYDWVSSSAVSPCNNNITYTAITNLGTQYVMFQVSNGDINSTLETMALSAK